MKYVETSGKTVDDAITAALLQLGLPSEQVDIEIIQEGSKGVLGIFGAKDAIVRATAKGVSLEEELFSDHKPEKEEKQAESAAKKPEVKKVSPEKVPEKKKEEPAYVMDTLVEDRLAQARAAKEAEMAKKEEPKEPIAYSEDAKVAEEAAIAFLLPVLKEMGIEAKIDGSMEEEDVLKLDIQGEGLGVIIGKRGNTLDSLQYLTALVANKKTEGHVKIKLDAENYREKRKQTLEKLAINLAKKVRKTNRRVALEPMNPYERRIIHSVLQSFNGVETHSEGEEPFRKVVISPVKGNYHHK
ncbi:MAG TPA: protein jag [Candidatus Faecimorpha stercoravium]|nr:protein jag [Candidatus Faecimorpha stercoravium]